MNYENASVLSNQNIVLKDRKKLEISGIKKIESLNSEEFLIESIMGYIVIKGSNLELLKLDTFGGTVSIKGKIYGINYLEENKKNIKESVVAKLFK